MKELSEVTEQLYETFSPYKVGDDFVDCDCCVSSEQSDKLGGTPLRGRTYEDLEHYARNAMSTWGDVSHFKYFLPRLLEFTIEHRDEFLDLAVIFGELAYAQWSTFQPAKYQLEAVRAALEEAAT